MSHAYHERLSGYDERQILHDGCPECEHRGQDLLSALAHMDEITFDRAWQRARDFGEGVDIGPVSSAESNLLRVFGAIQVRLARRALRVI